MEKEKINLNSKNNLNLFLNTSFFSSTNACALEHKNDSFLFQNNHCEIKKKKLSFPHNQNEMEEKKIVVIFKCKCNLTEFDECVCLSGSSSELGKWDLNRCICLNTETKTFPEWKTQSIFLKANSPIEYKYFIMKNKAFIDKNFLDVRWETITGCKRNGNRSIYIPAENFVICDEFDADSISKTCLFTPLNSFTSRSFCSSANFESSPKCFYNNKSNINTFIKKNTNSNNIFNNNNTFININNRNNNTIDNYKQTVLLSDSFCGKDLDASCSASTFDYFVENVYSPEFFLRRIAELVDSIQTHKQNSKRVEDYYTNQQKMMNNYFRDLTMELENLKFHNKQKDKEIVSIKQQNMALAKAVKALESRLSQLSNIFKKTDVSVENCSSCCNTHLCKENYKDSIEKAQLKILKEFKETTRKITSDITFNLVNYFHSFFINNILCNCNDSNINNAIGNCFNIDKYKEEVMKLKVEVGKKSQTNHDSSLPSLLFSFVPSDSVSSISLFDNIINSTFDNMQQNDFFFSSLFLFREDEKDYVNQIKNIKESKISANSIKDNETKKGHEEYFKLDDLKEAEKVINFCYKEIEKMKIFFCKKLLDDFRINQTLAKEINLNNALIKKIEKEEILTLNHLQTMEKVSVVFNMNLRKNFLQLKQQMNNFSHDFSLHKNQSIIILCHLLSLCCSVFHNPLSSYVSPFLEKKLYYYYSNHFLFEKFEHLKKIFKDEHFCLDEGESIEEKKEKEDEKYFTQSSKNMLLYDYGFNLDNESDSNNYTNSNTSLFVEKDNFIEEKKNKFKKNYEKEEINIEDDDVETNCFSDDNNSTCFNRIKSKITNCEKFEKKIFSDTDEEFKEKSKEEQSNEKSTLLLYEMNWFDLKKPKSQICCEENEEKKDNKEKIGEKFKEGIIAKQTRRNDTKKITG